MERLRVPSSMCFAALTTVRRAKAVERKEKTHMLLRIQSGKAVDHSCVGFV